MFEREARAVVNKHESQFHVTVSVSFTESDQYLVSGFRPFNADGDSDQCLVSRFCPFNADGDTLE